VKKGKKEEQADDEAAGKKNCGQMFSVWPLWDWLQILQSLLPLVSTFLGLQPQAALGAA